MATQAGSFGVTILCPNSPAIINQLVAKFSTFGGRLNAKVVIQQFLQSLETLLDRRSVAGLKVSLHGKPECFFVVRIELLHRFGKLERLISPAGHEQFFGLTTKVVG